MKPIPEARVDDFLERRATTSPRLAQWLLKAPPELIISADVELLTRELKLEEEDLPPALFRILESEDKEVQALAFLMLMGISGPLLAAEVDRSLRHTPPLNPEYAFYAEAIRLSAEVDIFCAGLTDGSDAAIEGIRTEALEYLLRAHLDAEDAAVIWLGLMSACPADVRAGWLRCLCGKAKREAFQAGVHLELERSEVEMLLRLPELLMSEGSSESLALLERLSEHERLEVRLEAQAALKNLNPASHKAELVDMGQWESWIDFRPSQGLHSILLHLKSPEGVHKILWIVVDSWDLGIRDVWFLSHLNETAASIVIKLLGFADCRSNLQTLRKEEAAGWLQAAEDLAHRRGTALPPIWPLLRRWWSGHESASPPKDVCFGLNCSECHEPLRRDDSASAPFLVLGPTVVCADCLKRKQQCDACGRALAPDATQAVARITPSGVTFLCPRCAEPSQPPHRRPQ